MPEFQHPGVYVEEIERGPRPIRGVPTSTAAFLGEAERGPLTARLITSYTDYERWFGTVFAPDKFLPHTLDGFFANGGTSAYVCRVAGKGATTAEAAFGDFAVSATGPGLWGTRVTVKISDGSRTGFRMQVAYEDQAEDLDDLQTDESSAGFYGKHPSALVTLVRSPGAAAGARPANGTAVLSGGADDPAPISVGDYESALVALESESFGRVSLVYAPNASADVAKAVVAHCEKMQYRFAVIDSAEGQSSQAQLKPRDSISGNSRAAFYYPWIFASEPGSGARTLTPPGGHVLGIYSRTDHEKGVFKAPANEVVRGALDVEFDINDAKQDVLNPRGVNVIRSFPGRGIRVWGSRTLASDAVWKYVNVRRLFIFLERSIYEGTQWVVFEPNDERLWGRVTTLVTLFLREQWRAGALAGRTDREAYYVKCDRMTMTQADIDDGRLICEVGVATAKPAEFVIFRIFQRTLSS